MTSVPCNSYTDCPTTADYFTDSHTCVHGMCQLKEDFKIPSEMREKTCTNWDNSTKWDNCPEGQFCGNGICQLKVFCIDKYNNNCSSNQVCGKERCQLKGTYVSCRTIKDKALDSHVDCYRECGFCAVIRENLMQYWDTIGVRDLDLDSMIEIAKDCTRNFIAEKGFQYFSFWDGTSFERMREELRNITSSAKWGIVGGKN
ncbi:hypothetical protein Ddc_19741 [Ditylenchus destructor]|nr:hypothetical protein Ddc_19741 [Ditylenchus destructor]